MPNALPPSLRSWLENARDWSTSELGPVESWSSDLLTAVASSLPLGPVALLWGPHLVRVYGPLYAPMVGDRHPEVLGEPVHVAWPEAWAQIEPYVDKVRSTGDVVEAELLTLHADRFGCDERLRLNVNFAPIRDHATGELLGIAVTAHDRTADVLAQLRAQATEAVGEVSVFNRSVTSTAARAMRAAAQSEDVVAIGAVLPCPQGTGQPGIVQTVTPGQPQPFPQLLELVRDCYADGCVQPDAGCRFASWDDGPPDSTNAHDRSVDDGHTCPPSVAQCRKLPGVDDADDVGRLVIALDTGIRPDGNQRAFLQQITRQTARVLRDARADNRGRENVEHLTTALDSNRTIGAAMGILMALNQLTPGQAFEELRSCSQNANRKLREVARDVVETGSLPTPAARPVGIQHDTDQEDPSRTPPTPMTS